MQIKGINIDCNFLYKLKSQIQDNNANNYHISPKTTKILSDKEIIHILDDFPSIPKDALIILNDLDRSTPSHRIIKYLRHSGKIIYPVTFIIASGTHKPISLEKAKILAGSNTLDRVLIHDCDKKQDLEYVGKTSRGTKVYIEKIVRQTNFILTINSVEPHYFAGFTGGVKSIISGLAGRITVEKNHSLAIKSRIKNINY